jgi:hypothetical protein
MRLASQALHCARHCIRTSLEYLLRHELVLVFCCLKDSAIVEDLIDDCVSKHAEIRASRLDILALLGLILTIEPCAPVISLWAVRRALPVERLRQKSLVWGIVHDLTKLVACLNGLRLSIRVMIGSVFQVDRGTFPFIMSAACRMQLMP